MRIAVTGATGLLGRFLVTRLIEGGAAVRAWRRPSSDLRGLPTELEWLEGSLADSGSAEALVHGADALIHAALDHVHGRYRGGEGDDLAGFLRTNIGESLALLATARDAGVKRCIVLSSRAVFDGRTQSGLIGDDDPLAPASHYGAAKTALEAFVQSFGRGDGWAICALRPTGVYGFVDPVERSKWFDLVQMALKGEMAPVRAGTEVHGRDVAESVWRLMQAPEDQIAGRSFNCSDLVVSTRDIVATVQRLTGAPGPLPDEAPRPANIMNCPGLNALGVRFGGKPLFERTIAELVEAARRAPGQS